jgi:methionyl aminopeptidase
MGIYPILKTPEEIEIMKVAGRMVAEGLKIAKKLAVPGVSTLEIDQAVEDYFVSNGGVPAFKGYPAADPSVAPFPGTICASINEEVVHGIPSADRVLREGQIISIDVGVKINGFFGDAARSFPVGEVGRKAQKLLDIGMKSLQDGIKVMRPGVPLSRVSKAVQDCVEKNKFSVVRKFVGHGIGRDMHEPPQVPNFVGRRFPEKTIVLDPGSVIALEPMVNAGTDDVEVLDDGWTVVTKDRKLSVHFENSIAMTKDGPVILTEV